MYKDTFALICQNHEFTLIRPTPLQHHGVHSSFLPFHTWTFFLWQWGAWLHIHNLFIRSTHPLVRNPCLRPPFAHLGTLLTLRHPIPGCPPFTATLLRPQHVCQLASCLDVLPSLSGLWQSTPGCSFEDTQLWLWPPCGQPSWEVTPLFSLSSDTLLWDTVSLSFSGSCLPYSAPIHDFRTVLGRESRGRRKGGKEKEE